MPESREWIRQLLRGPGDLDRISAAVREAEKRTAAEIVPMIVHRSVAVGHIPWLVFLILFIAFWVALPFVFELMPYGRAWMWELGALAVAGVLSQPLSRLDWVVRLLTTAEDETLAVERRALLEFHLLRIASTRAGTGVLIFVSQLEHRAVVLADCRIAERFPSETWESAIQELIGNIKKGDFTGGMCATIESLGVKLAQEFPCGPNDCNELSDRLIVKD